LQAIWIWTNGHLVLDEAPAAPVHSEAKDQLALAPVDVVDLRLLAIRAVDDRDVNGSIDNGECKLDIRDTVAVFP
jgi:hypothetical protein